jgi:signal peptidase II
MTLLAAIAARRAHFLVAAAVLVADQASKIAADLLLRGRGPVSVIPGCFNLWYSRNRGGLFGYFSAWEDPWRSLLLTVFPLLAVGAIVVFLARTDEPDRATLAGLASILGGATGNLIDRVFRGEVVDFLDAYVSHAGVAQWLIDRFGTAHWPTFNLADSAIVTGAGLLLLDLFRAERASGPAGKAPDLPSSSG